jgi:hypothetical protein
VVGTGPGVAGSGGGGGGRKGEREEEIGEMHSGSR